MFVLLFNCAWFCNLPRSLRGTQNYWIACGSDGVEDQSNQDNVVDRFEFLVFEASEDDAEEDYGIYDGRQQAGIVHNRVVVFLDIW